MLQKTRKKTFNTVTIIVMIILLVLFVMPYIWMVLNSFKDKIEIAKARKFLPEEFTFKNYVNVFTGSPIVYWFFNSVIVTVTGTVGMLFTCSIAGFVFAKYEFKGKHVIFVAVLATMMVPSQVTMIPSFLLIDRLHMYDTLWALIVPGIVGAYGMFMCKSFIEDIPDSLCEAAVIDGARDSYVYFRIIIPLIRPAIGALAIFTFLGKWNDYLGPLLYLADPKRMTMPLALKYFSSRNSQDIGAIMAAATLVTLPVTVVYLFMQKQFIKGIAITGMK